MKKNQIRTAVFALLIAVVFTAGRAGANGTEKSEEENDDVKLTYKLGKGITFKTRDGDYSLNLSARLQGRFTYNSLETAPDTNTFAIQRGKPKITGNALDENLKYAFQMVLSTANGGVATLEDFYLDWVPTDYFGIQGGQFKAPFLIQELTSSGSQQFVDRGLSTGFFNLGRDIGVSFHGDIWKDKLGYAVFAMNGDRANTINTNQGIMTGVRLDGHLMGEYKHSESDVDDSQEPNLGVGLAYVYHDSLNSTGTMSQSGTVAVGTKSSMGTFDAGYKYRGLSLQGAFMLTKTHEGASVTNTGYNAQAGYFIIPKKFEVAVRGGGAFFDGATPNQYEYGTALNYFIKGHGLKWQTDYALLMNNRGLNLNDHRFRTQVQVIF